MLETVGDVGEFGLIHRIETVLRDHGVAGARLTVGLGDDAAAFRPNPGFDLLVTCDSLVEGRHFLSERTTPLALGRRSMAVNISDVGAMGGRPLYALVSLGLRGDTPVSYVEELYRGFLEELNPFQAAVIGGNLTKAAEASFIDVTLIGEVEPDKVIRRSTARPGDAILVTGFPGQAAAGLQLLLAAAVPADVHDHPLVREYCQPTHRAREGRAVAQAGLATAMIDTSDGFLGDLGHICEESKVGADLVEGHLPMSRALRDAAARLSKDPLDWMLGDSDDYELIILCPQDRVESVRRAIAAVSDVPVACVGTLTGEPGVVRLLQSDGERRRLSAGGWDHFAAKGKDHA